MAAKDYRRAVALVDIAIDGQGALDASVPLHLANGDGDIVDDAEALAVIGKGVVEAAAEVHRDAVAKRLIGSQNRSSGHQPKAFDQRLAVGHLEFEFLAHRKSSGFQLVDVTGRVHQQHVFVGGGLGLDKILGSSSTE